MSHTAYRLPIHRGPWLLVRFHLMQEICSPPSEGSILAVLVLYGCAASESQSYRSLLDILSTDADLASRISLLIYDNSPGAHPLDEKALPGINYVHDAANPGLAAAYNFALARAAEKQFEWLLLLDQDTMLTREFLVELLQSTSSLHAKAEVASIVPKLTFHGDVCSPTANFLHQLRRPYMRSYAVARETTGIQLKPYFAFNSGATLRVSALQSIGGFPSDYWLDYLDHATFAALSARGYCMYILKSELEHESSQGAVGSVSPARLRNLLSAQACFVRENGKFLDRALYRLWLLRCARIWWLRHPDKSLGKEAAMQALGLNTGLQPASTGKPPQPKA